MPLGERRQWLLREIGDGPLVLPARRLDADGIKAWQQVLARGYEGLIAKNEGSRYSGGPTTDWCKVKVRHEGRFLVGGIADVQGDFGGVLVGQRVGGELRHRGTVEWGFTGWTVTDLLVRSKLLVRATSPFADKSARHGVVWLEPRLAFEVSYAEVTQGRLRAPVVRRLVTPARRLVPYPGRRYRPKRIAHFQREIEQLRARAPRGIRRRRDGHVMGTGGTHDVGDVRRLTR